MSGKGISAFYGASTPAGAVKEVAGYAHSTHSGTLGAFTQLRDIAVVDLTNPARVPSLFDPSSAHLRPAARFMRDFIADVSRVADPADGLNLDYVPTQIIAEFFRVELKVSIGEIEGVVWRSSKDQRVECCVIFADNDAMVELSTPVEGGLLALDETTLRTLPSPLSSAYPVTAQPECL